MEILIRKARRSLIVLDGGGQEIFQAKIALGQCPAGPKEKSGDQRTPEGEYFVCLKKRGKYGPSLGISYPNSLDAMRQGAEEELIQCIRQREEMGIRPPWGTFLGGEIFIHGGGTASDWTAGCIALSDEDAERLYNLVPLCTKIVITAE